MKTLLPVGCGPKRKDLATAAFNTPTWSELCLDIDQSVQLDIVGTMLDMSVVPNASMDAVYFSHKIKHFYLLELPLALVVLRRVFKPKGFVVIACPDCS